MEFPNQQRSLSKFWSWTFVALALIAVAACDDDEEGPMVIR